MLRKIKRMFCNKKEDINYEYSPEFLKKGIKSAEYDVKFYGEQIEQYKNHVNLYRIKQAAAKKLVEELKKMLAEIEGC